MLPPRTVSGKAGWFKRGKSSPSSWPRCRASTISRTKLLSPFCWVKCAAKPMTVLNLQPWSSSAGLAPPAPGEGKLGHRDEGEGGGEDEGEGGGESEGGDEGEECAGRCR